MNLTRGERFKDARIVRNQHGKQTMDEVAAATGIKKSLIQALENDDNDRDVGYTKVATLAAHYRVTADFLLGFTNDPHPKRTAIDDLGITPAVANRFKELCSDRLEGHIFSQKMSQLLENQSVWNLLLLLMDYISAAQTDKIYKDLLAKYQFKHDDETIAKDLETLAEQNQEIDFVLSEFLHAKARAYELDGHFANIGMLSFDMTELMSAKIDRQLSAVLSSIEDGCSDGND